MSCIFCVILTCPGLYGRVGRPGASHRAADRVAVVQPHRVQPRVEGGGCSCPSDVFFIKYFDKKFEELGLNKGRGWFLNYPGVSSDFLMTTSFSG